jgi:hypothetical protein
LVDRFAPLAFGSEDRESTVLGFEASGGGAMVSRELFWQAQREQNANSRPSRNEENGKETQVAATLEMHTHNVIDECAFLI